MRCPANILRAGPPDQGADKKFGNASQYMGSGFYHGKVYQSMRYARDFNQLVSTNTQYSSVENHREVVNLDFRQNMMDKAQLAKSPMDINEPTLKDVNLCYFLDKK